MKKTNDTRYFFILLSNGDTIYFSVEKENEIYKIYCEDFVKTFNQDKSKVTPGHSIELTKDNFILKDNIGMTICSLKEDYNKIRTTYNPNNLEIQMLYILMYGYLWVSLKKSGLRELVCLNHIKLLWI